MIFLGSERSATADVDGPVDMSADGANFSAGSLTVAKYNTQQSAKLKLISFLKAMEWYHIIVQFLPNDTLNM